MIENSVPLETILKDINRFLAELEDNAVPVIISQAGKPVFVALDLNTYDRLRSAESFLTLLTRNPDVKGEMKIR